MRTWWQQRPAPVQVILGIVGGIVAVGVVLRLLVTLTGGPRAQGPESSSFATSPPGVAAWAQLLSDEGHPVARLRAPLTGRGLDTNTTLVVLDSELDIAERFALQDFVRGGGHLVIGGSAMADRLGDILGGDRTFPLTTDEEADAEIQPGAMRADEQGQTRARRIRVAGTDRFSRVSPLRRMATTASGNAVVLRDTQQEPGSVLLIADASFLQNRLLGEADNAAFALDLVGPGPVAFAENGHGYSDRGGLLGGGVLPSGWSWFLTGLVLAFALWAYGEGRRIGPPRVAHRQLPPPRVRYVDSMAARLSGFGPMRAMAPPTNPQQRSSRQTRDLTDTAPANLEEPAA